jgi:hypothetical protein
MLPKNKVKKISRITQDAYANKHPDQDQKIIIIIQIPIIVAVKPRSLLIILRKLCDANRAKNNSNCEILATTIGSKNK